MSEAKHIPWLSVLLDSVQSNKSVASSRFMQLATVDKSGNPAVRTLVYRGCDPATGFIVMHTDSRSTKISELKQHATAQLCWYFSETREQYRISGTTELVDSHTPSFQQLRLNQWNNLSLSSRASYQSHQPGTALDINSEAHTISQDQRTVEEISNHFMLILLFPNEVDHLQLKQTPHKRAGFRLLDKQWCMGELNP